MGRLRPRLTYANVVSTIALAFALGGGAVYAAGKIGSSQIAKNAIHSRQIKNHQVKRQDIAGGAINSRKVSNDSLTGKDIQESTLGEVPLASDARTVGQIAVRSIHAAQPDPTGTNQVLSQGGLIVLLSCSGGVATMQVHGAVPGDAGSIFASTGGTQQFDSGSSSMVTTGGANPGFVTVRRIDGTVTRFDYDLERVTNGFGSSDDCFLHGFLLSGR
jgi:hypothetical protein